MQVLGGFARVNGAFWRPANVETRHALILSHNLTELVHFVKITTLPTVLTVGLNEKARTVTVLKVSDLVS